MAYTNGRLPASALAFIPGTSQRVRADLLPQTVALRAAFKEQFGRDLIITDGYRSYEQQVITKALKGSFAATPGKSVHGWGAALDLGSGVNFSLTSPEHRWMRDNGRRFGWVNPDWARDGDPKNGQFEPWHHEAVGVIPVSSYITIPGAVPHIPAVTPPAPLTPTVQEDDMLSLILWCYRALMGREPSTDEVTSWLTTTTGKTTAQVAEMFLGAAAEPGSVVQAYRDYLGRTPTQTDITAWLHDRPTVRAVRAGVAGSPEAKSRKG